MPPHSRTIILLVGVLPLLAGALFSASPASASGGATIWVKADREWRTQSFVISDHQIPDACPGPTTHKLTMTARLKGGPKGFWIKNIRLKNTTKNVQFSVTVDWNSRLKDMRPVSPEWTRGVTKTMYNPSWVNDGSKVASYQDWTNKKGLHTLDLHHLDGGEVCHPSYQIVVKKW